MKREAETLNAELNELQGRRPRSKAAKEEVQKNRDEAMTELESFFAIDKETLEDRLRHVGELEEESVRETAITAGLLERFEKVSKVNLIRRQLLT